MPRGRKAPAAIEAAQPISAGASAGAPDLTFDVDWSKLRTPDILLFQRFARADQLPEAERNALALDAAPLLDRCIVGGMPDLEIDRYGDIITVFMLKMKARGNPGN